MNILCGYNVNIDSVYRVSGIEISELLESFEKTEILEKIEKPPGKILSESDFVAGLAYCMKNGCGAEWLVLEPGVFEFLKNRYFGKSLVRMGGNAGIMANALSQLGASRVIPNVAVPSKIQLSLFSDRSIYFPGSATEREEISHVESEEIGSKEISSKEISSKEINSEIIDSKENMYAVSRSQDPIHFVFDFSKGDTFSLYGTSIVVPRENRFIATCDHLNLRLYVNPAFERYALEHAPEIDGALISGFHLMLENYPDGSSYKTILENVLNQLKSWKAENNKLRIHLEFGHFANKEIASFVFHKFTAISDSIGMNEDELATLSHLHGVPGEEIRHMEVEAVGNAAYRLALLCGIKKIVTHTREFVLTVFKPDSESYYKLASKIEPGSISKLNSESVSGSSADFRAFCEMGDCERLSLQKSAGNKLEALRFGVSCAGTYAASGRLEGREFVAEEASKLQESAIGRKQLNLFLSAFKAQSLGQGAYAFNGDYIICMLPTLLSKNPITTVGLGDTIAAGIFLRELELDVQA